MLKGRLGCCVRTCQTDALRVFVRVCCRIGPAESVRADDLASSAALFFAASGVHPCERRIFDDLLRQAGHTFDAGTWRGIGLRGPAPDPAVVAAAVGEHPERLAFLGAANVTEVRIDAGTNTVELRAADGRRAEMPNSNPKDARTLASGLRLLRGRLALASDGAVIVAGWRRPKRAD